MVQKVDDSQKKYKYEITLVVHRNVCKSDLGFKATGFNNWQDNFTVQVKCKTIFYFTRLVSNPNPNFDYLVKFYRW